MFASGFSLSLNSAHACSDAYDGLKAGPSNPILRKPGYSADMLLCKTGKRCIIC